MSVLTPTEYYATITWLGIVDDATPRIRARPVPQVEAGFAGITGEAHSGLTRPSCVRMVAQYPKGTEIRNVRQLSILSAEELDLIAADMGVDAVDPAHLGASMVVKGIPDFTYVPPNARLQGENGTTLTIDMENLPCQLPAREIEADAPGTGKAFKAAAQNRRGVTAWIEAEGSFALGDRLRLHVPAQRAWAPPA